VDVWHLLEVDSDSYLNARIKGIKTIINLRGESDNDGWYQEEKTASDHLGLVHIDFPMSALKQLTLAESNSNLVFTACAC
jgi:hypothetical protein